MNRLFHRKYNIHITINGHRFSIPNEHHVFYTLHEVFTWKLYKKLVGCEYVLDIGGFIGDTAIGLSETNKKIYVYEPNPSNFEYIKINTVQNANIIAVNGAVMGKNTVQLYYEGDDFNAGGRITTTKTSIPVNNYNIIDILKMENFDGLKMDIEGGEYDILKVLIEENNFPFQKGYIEFHDYINNNTNKENITIFLNFLRTKDYSTTFENVFGKNIKTEDIFNLDPKIFVLFFHKNA